MLHSEEYEDTKEGTLKILKTYYIARFVESDVLPSFDENMSFLAQHNPLCICSFFHRTSKLSNHHFLLIIVCNIEI